MITSSRGGMGKSLFIQQKSDELDKYVSKNASARQKDRFQNHSTVVRTPVHGTAVNYNDIVSNLSSNSISDDDFPRMYHFDVAPTVKIIPLR